MGARVAVLVSGSGTNLQALLDDERIAPSIVLVLSDRSEVKALDRATDRGIETEVIPFEAHLDRDSFTDAVREALRRRGVDTVVLAGYMRVLGPAFFDAFPGRVLNVHPALLPAFPGAHAVADTLEWGAKVTGVTVHLVDEQVDHGPIVLQEALEIREDDDWDSLEARIHEIEHRLLPSALLALLEGRLEVDGRRVRLREDAR